MRHLAKKFILFLLLMGIITGSAASDEARKEKPRGFLNDYQGFVQTMPDDVLIASPNAVGAKTYHRHLVRPGAETTWLVRVLNSEAAPATVSLEVTGAPEGWAVSLAEDSVKLDPGASKYVLVTLKPAASVPDGKTASIVVHAKSSSGKFGEVTLDAGTTAKHKIYYISIDSFGDEYLKLNSKGAGPGKEGDWLMPNLHAFLSDSAFYPEHKAHLVSATDMNHASFLSGAYPGRLGLYSVQVYLFGFDAKGRSIARVTPLDIMYYGKDGKPVTTIFNVVKDPSYGGNPDAFAAYISGKTWVPEHYRNPVFGLDRIVSVSDRPDYATSCASAAHSARPAKQMIQTHFHKLRDPNLFVWEDACTVDQAIDTINAEDPDVSYILLGGVDMAGHSYGSGKDPDEWDTRKTPDDLSDDISKVNAHANREGIITTLKGTDAEFGRLIDYLKKRGDFDNSYVIVESDHNMETNFFDGPKVQNILRKTEYSPKKDYFLFTASQMGAVFLRRENPKIIPDMEKALESYRMKNPLTGEIECPMIVLTRDEMRTGVDTVSGQTISAPGELYSEYYIEHPKPRGLIYPDMMIFAKKYYQFPIAGASLGNVGLGVLPFDVPPINIFVGGHGSISTQPALLSIRGPSLPRGRTYMDQTWSSDVAPTLYRLEGYKIPESVQGKGLPKLDPTLR